MKWSRSSIGCLAASAFLASCAHAPSDAAQRVYALKATLAAAITAADAYSALPRCPQSQNLCQDPMTSARIYVAAQLVSQDLNAAQAAVTSGQSAAAVALELQTAQTDLDALTLLTSQVKTK